MDRLDSNSNNNDKKLGQSHIKLETTNSILNILEDATIMGNPNYQPKELVVNKDSTIIVKNTDTMPHTVTNGENPNDIESGKIFDTSIINGGDSYELTLKVVNSGEISILLHGSSIYDWNFDNSVRILKLKNLKSNFTFSLYNNRQLVSF